MKKTYFYGNHKIRTSEHDYKYALIVDDGNGIYVKKCSATFQGCEKEMNRISKLYDALLETGISYDEYRNRVNERHEFYMTYKRLPENNDLDDKVSKIIHTKRIWSDQCCDRRKLKIVELEAR